MRCPLYRQVNDHLEHQGWKQTHFNGFKTGNGDHCELRYEKTGEGEVDGKREDILYSLEIVIEGQKDTCGLKAFVDTHKATNRLESIDHISETDVIRTLETVVTS